jgi:hypothetical protein
VLVPPLARSARSRIAPVRARMSLVQYEVSADTRSQPESIRSQ